MPWPARPHAGVTSAWRRSRNAVAAATGELAPAVDEVLPQRRGLLADGAVGRDRAPRDPPVALQVPAQRRRVREQRGRDLDTEDLRAGVERDAKVALAAHVHTDGAGHRGERAREQIGRALAVDRRLTVAERDEAGLVEEEHEVGVGKPLGDDVLERTRPCAREQHRRDRTPSARALRRR